MLMQQDNVSDCSQKKKNTFLLVCIINNKFWMIMRVFGMLSDAGLANKKTAVLANSGLDIWS